MSRETIHPYTVTVPLAQRLAECSAVIEIWHQIPKNDTRPAPIAGKVFGRRLASSFKDVCLGHTVIPLISLLEKQTGERGITCKYMYMYNVNCLHVCTLIHLSFVSVY